MGKRSPLHSSLLTLATFLVLEGLTVLLILNSSVIGKYKIMSTVSELKFSVIEFSDRIHSSFQLKEVNEQLMAENSRLMASIFANKHSAVDSLQAVIKDSAFTFTPAYVIHNDINSTNNYIILNKGSKDSISQDMGVITTNGVIGYVESVSTNYCKVKSLLSINNNIGGLINSSNTYGTLDWRAKDSKHIYLTNIPVHTVFSVKDTVSTSGFSFMYPKGIPLGTIVSHKLKGGTDIEIQVELFEDFHSLSYVYIVKNNNIEELNKLIDKEDNK